MPIFTVLLSVLVLRESFSLKASVDLEVCFPLRSTEIIIVKHVA